MGMFMVLQVFVQKQSFKNDVFDLMIAPKDFNKTYNV